MSRLSRRDGVIGVLCAGTWMMPLTAAGTGLVQGTVIVVTSRCEAPMGRYERVVGLGRLDALPQPKLEMVRSQCHALEMALEEVTIIIGQLLPAPLALRWLRSAATTSASISAAGTRLTDPGRLGLSLQHDLGDVIAVAGAALVGMAWAHAVAANVKQAAGQEAGEPCSRLRRATAWAASLPCTSSNSAASRMGSCSPR